MKKRETSGRFEVGDKLCPSLHSAIAYAMHVVGRDGHPRTLYVRDVASGRSYVGVTRNEDGGVTQVLPGA